jgi:hypothetical protein
MNSIAHHLQVGIVPALLVKEDIWPDEVLIAK